MRSLWFMPVTFVAGQHGFAMFAPYLAAFLAFAHFTRGRRHSGSASKLTKLMPAAATQCVAGLAVPIAVAQRA